MILSLNTGSTNTKFKVFDWELNCLMSGKVEKGQNTLSLEANFQDQTLNTSASRTESSPAELILQQVLARFEIERAGFRIVHGGEKFITPTLLSQKVLTELEEVTQLAPIHNPLALKEIAEFREILPEIPFYGVFDTAFHAQMPKKAYLYALPYKYYQKYQVRKFGFHGISHQYISQEVQKLEPNVKKVISCHLGGGASVCAILNGKSLDNSMGFTPMEGLIMATRAGDVDDGVIPYILNKEKISLDAFKKIENNASGLLGISGETGDMKTLLGLEKQGHTRAKLAIEMYIYRVQKYIGAFTAALGGMDCLVFTAGVGAGSDVIRDRICENLGHLGVFIDDNINNGRQDVSSALKISTANSIPIWIIPTNEELQIAREISGLTSNPE